MQPELIDALAAEVALTMKTALAPVQADVQTLRAQIAAWESRWHDVSALRERIATLEVKAPIVLSDPAVADLREQMKALDLRVSGVTPEIAALRERAAVLETRAPIPGPAGVDGMNGMNGADGLGFEDLDVSLSGDRTLVFRFARGDHEKTFPVVVGWPKYQKRWIDGKAYVPGDIVTWDGHLWDCQDATDTGQPGISKAWLQSVTRGRSGKDGKDGRDAVPLPVVTVGGRK